MANVQQSPYYTGNSYDPSARAADVSQGIGGLAEALFGNPGKAAAFQNQQSETQKNLADALLGNQKFSARDHGLEPALTAMLSSSGMTPQNQAHAIALAAQGDINPGIFNSNSGYAQRDSDLKTAESVATEHAKPLKEDEVKAQILQNLLAKDPKAAQAAAFPPRANGDVVFDPQTGTMSTVDSPVQGDIANSPQQHGAVDYAAPAAPVDKSTMGSMINSLGAPADQSIPKGPALPPPALNSTLSPDLPPAAAKDITKAATPIGATSAQSSTPQANAPAFGFSVPHSLNKEVYKSMVDNDNKLFAAQNVNDVKANNIISLLDEIEPNLGKFKTGFGGGARLFVDKALAQVGDGSMGNDAATAGANIDTKTQALVNELQGFQPSPGARNSVMGLQTLLASKPGISQPQETNLSNMAEIRAKVTDYKLSTELQQRYREASPMHITDANTHTLDDALKTIFPLQDTDQKTGAVTFNKSNALKIHQSIPDAIANPKAYIDKANAILSGQSQPEASAPTAPQGPKTGGVLHVDANGNKAMVFPDGHFEEVK